MADDANLLRLSQISTMWTVLAQAHAGAPDDVTAARPLLIERYGGAVQGYLRAAIGDPAVRPAHGHPLAVGRDGEGTGRSIVGERDIRLDRTIGHAEPPEPAGPVGDMMFGQEGMDQMWGLAGADLMFGGTDADIMSGGDDRDILFGGAGDDALDGGAGDDILGSGTTSYELDLTDLSGLTAIRAEWTSARDYVDRVDNIRGDNNPTFTARRNDNYFLETQGENATVTHPPGAEDSLIGGTGSDWFFGHAAEYDPTVWGDRSAGERVNA